jgi:hypothetical protein
MTPAQRRRRLVLIVLIGSALVSLGLALLISPLLWIVVVAAVVLLAVYLFLLYLVKQHGFAASGDHYFWDSSPDNRAVAVAHPRVRARPELAPMPGPSRQRRSAAG